MRDLPVAAGAARCSAALLRHAGFEDVVTLIGVTTAEVVAFCRESTPVLILLDAMGPKDCISLADAIATAGLSPRPILLAVTPPLTDALRVQLLEAGIADLVGIDAPKAELVIRTGNLVRQHQIAADAQERVAELEQLLEERTQRLQEAVDVLRAAERRLNEQLAASRAESRSKSELLATAAHELRTPLDAIIGFSDLIRAETHGPLGDPRYAEYCSDIHHAASHLAAVVDGTLDLAKAESGAEQLEIRNVDVGRVVQDSVRILKRLADAGGVILNAIVPDTPLMIRTDPEKVRQVVVNLASNAVKFTPQGGRVTVEVQADPAKGAIIMVIRDTGIGMATQDIPTALRPFGQVRQADRPHPKGTGLGLPLTRRFVELLGGELSIQSQPGHGTVVTVRLPVDLMPATADASQGLERAH